MSIKSLLQPAAIFIHSGYLYSAPSRNLRGALSPATGEEKCLEKLAEGRHIGPGSKRNARRNSLQCSTYACNSSIIIVTRVALSRQLERSLYKFLLIDLYGISQWLLSNTVSYQRWLASLSSFIQARDWHIHSANSG